MNKNTWKVMGVFLLLSLVFSCQQEMPESVKPEERVSTEAHQGKKFGSNARHSFTICEHHVIRGRRLRGLLDCDPGFGICGTIPVKCNEFEWRFPEIWCVPDCPDPWRIWEKFDPSDFIIPDLEIFDRVKSMTVLPVNIRTVALQFYSPIDGILDEKTLTLKTSLALDESTVESLGLEGKVVPPGVSFPVIYNDENQTYNAIVSVANFPINHASPIAEIKPSYFDGYIDDLFKDFSLNQHPKAVLQETSEGFQITSDNSSDKGIFLFTPDGESLGLMFYDPSPQPSALAGDPTPDPLIKLKNAINLDQGIARTLRIKSFVLKPENLHQSFDAKTGILTVFITP